MLLPLAVIVGMAWATGQHNAPDPIFAKGERILFQGDSITDGNRGRSTDPNHILGHGYAFIIAAKYGATYPERKLTFVNRGVSGDTIDSLSKRWQADALDIGPDVLSLLIGINDVGAALEDPASTLTRYEQTYDRLLADARKANGRIKFVLCEPFCLAGARNASNLPQWQSVIQGMRSAIDRLATKYHAPVVHLQRVFDEACRRAPIDYWIWDGIHPTYSGHQLIADEWIRSYRTFYRNSKN